MQPGHPSVSQLCLVISPWSTQPGHPSVARRDEYVGSVAADMNVVDKDGKTPLMLAVINGFQSLVELLLRNDADVSVTNQVKPTVTTCM